MPFGSESPHANKPRSKCAVPSPHGRAHSSMSSHPSTPAWHQHPQSPASAPPQPSSPLELLTPSERRAPRIYESQVAPVWQAAGLQVTVHTTRRAGEGSQVASDLDLRSFDILVAVGGDGTLHEMLQVRQVLAEACLASVSLGSGVVYRMLSSLQPLLPQDTSKLGQGRHAFHGQISRWELQPMQLSTLQHPAGNTSEGRSHTARAVVDLQVFGTVGLRRGLQSHHLNVADLQTRAIADTRFGCVGLDGTA